MDGFGPGPRARLWSLALALALVAMGPAVAGGAAVAPAADPADVLTFHGDNLRSGRQPAEAVLTPQALAGGGLGQAWTSPTLDGDVYGQPLYVHGLDIGGQPHDALYVATEADSVWALDARTGQALWGPVTVGTPAPRSALPCGNIDPVGITGTPVIDPQRGALYAVALTTPDGGTTLKYELVALALATGAELPGFPVAVGPGTPAFDPHVQEQRGALTLLPGGNTLDIPFGGYFGDCGDYHGHVTQVWLPNPAHQADYSTPTGREGGLWTAGGLAYGPEGALFGVTGNSDGASPGDMGNSVLRLLPTPHLSQPAGPSGFFAPSNALSLDRADRDLGSGGPLLLPRQPGPYPYLLFTMGKQGVGYLIDRWLPGGIGTGDGVAGEGVFSTCMYGDCGAQAAVFTTASSVLTGDGSQYVLTAGRAAQAPPCTGSGGLEAWRLVTGAGVWQPHLALAWCGPSMADPGSPTVSSNGTDGVVAWVIDTAADRLLALDGQTGHLLWESSARGSGALPPVHRFTVPTVADGQVFVGGKREVVAYGLG